jgi:hypothetical protein
VDVEARRLHRAPLGLIVAATLCAPPLCAQTVSGIVAVVETADRIRGAEVSLTTSNGEFEAGTRSGENGEFSLEASQAGTYVLRVHHAGYKGQTATLILQSDRVLEVRVNLAPEATPIDGITVYGLTAETPEQREFLSRRHLPWNYSFDLNEIERTPGGDLTEIIQARAVLLGRCMNVFLDGRPSRFGGAEREYMETPISWVYGIEVYRHYYDVPMKYRDPIGHGANTRSVERCGAILIWTRTPPGSALASVWSLALGASAGWERGLFEIGWRPYAPDRYVFAVRIRVGEYVPSDLFGRAGATDEGFDPDTRPLFGSIYVGAQGPIPLLPPNRVAYWRIGAGTSGYLGQSSTTSSDGDEVAVLLPSITPFFGMGGEVAVGVRVPGGSIHPFIETRTGSEYVTRRGMRWIPPVVAIGIEYSGRRTFER